MTVNIKNVTILNLSYERNISFEGDRGEPNIYIKPRQTVSIDLAQVQLNESLINALLPHVQSNRIEVRIDGILLSYAEVGSLKYISTTGSVSSHALVGSSHVASGLIPGQILTALTPTTFGFAAAASLIEAFVVGAGRNAIVTNIYLNSEGNLPTNLTRIVIPFDAVIVGIGASSNGSFVWTAEISKNGLPAIIASLNVTGVSKAWNGSLNIDVDAGDAFSIYCNGININRPSVKLYMKRR